jgi:hypothetical protein
MTELGFAHRPLSFVLRRKNKNALAPRRDESQAPVVPPVLASWPTRFASSESIYNHQLTIDKRLAAPLTLGLRVGLLFTSHLLAICFNRRLRSEFSSGSFPGEAFSLRPHFPVGDGPNT